MGYMHAMTCQTEGIQSTAPVQWRSFDAMMGVFWEAEGVSGATGYYSSPDPRIMLFFNDVSEHIFVTATGEQLVEAERPLLRALYVPAGVPMRTRFSSNHRFTHLDVHLSKNWLVDQLAPIFGRTEALSAAARPVETQDVEAIAAIGETLKREIISPRNHPLYAESLALALVLGLIENPESDRTGSGHPGGLTRVQLRQVQALLQADESERVSNAELASAVGLSTNWFCQAFKTATGKTPLQWQQERKISLAKEALLSGETSIAEVATRFGFTDQAHLTKVFRRHEGNTPGAWLRSNRRNN